MIGAAINPSTIAAQIATTIAAQIATTKYDGIVNLLAR